MFLYVKSLKGEFGIIQKHEIKNFNVSTYKNSKKYVIHDDKQNDYEATVVFFSGNYIFSIQLLIKYTCSYLIYFQYLRRFITRVKEEDCYIPSYSTTKIIVAYRDRRI